MQKEQEFGDGVTVVLCLPTVLLKGNDTFEMAIAVAPVTIMEHFMILFIQSDTCKHHKRTLVGMMITHHLIIRSY